MDDDLESEIIKTLEALSPTQRRRALAVVAGKSISEIALADDVSPQAVRQSINAPAVRDSIADLISRSQFQETAIHDDGSKEIVGVVPLVEKALATLGGMLGATKFIAHGRDLTEVPDNHTRMVAAIRILDLSRPPPQHASEFVEEHGESFTRRRIKAKL